MSCHEISHQPTEAKLPKVKKSETRQEKGIGLEKGRIKKARRIIPWRRARYNKPSETSGQDSNLETDQDKTQCVEGRAQTLETTGKPVAMSADIPAETSAGMPVNLQGIEHNLDPELQAYYVPFPTIEDAEEALGFNIRAITQDWSEGSSE